MFDLLWLLFIPLIIGIIFFLLNLYGFYKHKIYLNMNDKGFIIMNFILILIIGTLLCPITFYRLIKNQWFVYGIINEKQSS